MEVSRQNSSEGNYFPDLLFAMAKLTKLFCCAVVVVRMKLLLKAKTSLECHQRSGGFMFYFFSCFISNNKVKSNEICKHI